MESFQFVVDRDANTGLLAGSVPAWPLAWAMQAVREAPS